MADNTKLNFVRSDFLQVFLPALSGKNSAYETARDLTPDLLMKVKKNWGEITR